MTRRGPREKMGPQFGVHRATARLRRRDGQQNEPPLPSALRPLSCLYSVCGESRRKAGWAGTEEGLPASTFLPLSLPEAGRPPKVLTGLASEGGVQATTRAPGPGAGVTQAESGPGPGQGLRPRQGRSLFP